MNLQKNNLFTAKKKKSAPVRKICPECGLNVYNLTNHMIGVHGNQQHTCHHCQLVLKTKARLQVSSVTEFKYGGF